MRKSIPGAISICLAATLWGLDGVVLTPRLYNLSVPFVVLLLHLIPFVLMQPFFARRWADLRRLRAQEWVALTLVALCGGIVGTFAIVKALFLVNFNQVSVVVLLQKLQPVFAIALAALVLGERVTKGFLTWAALAISGAYLLAFGFRTPELVASHTNTAAAAWAAVAAAAFGSATVFGKKLLQSLDFRLATFARFGVTTMLALVYLWVSGEGLPFEQVTPTNWLLIIFIGLTTGSGAIFLYYYGLSRVRAMVSAICELCLPLSAIVFDYLINGSVLGPWQWLGAALLVMAIFKVSIASNPPPAISQSTT
jgi:drug/metabolite transporter (DMT)-like permease